MKRGYGVPIEVYRHDSMVLAHMFDKALEDRDGKELSRILIQAAALMRQLLKALKAKYTKRFYSMGARKPKYTWEGWLPADVMADLRNTMGVQEDWISRANIKIKLPGLSKKAKALARSAVKAVEKDLRVRIRDGRKWINDRWPGWWTPQVEEDFGDWL